MTRSKRMQPVVRAVGHDERESASRLGEADRRVADAEQRLVELQAYHAEYANSLGAKAATGMSVTGLRDYQAFLARLAEAVSAQGRVVESLKAEREGARNVWRAAAQRAKAIDHVVDRWRTEERAAADRREQIETDERAQRVARTGTSS